MHLGGKMKKILLFIGIIVLMATSTLAWGFGQEGFEAEDSFYCIDQMQHGNYTCSWEIIEKVDESRPVIEYYTVEECYDDANCTQEPTTLEEFYEYCTIYEVCENVTKENVTYPYTKNVYRYNEVLLHLNYVSALENIDNGLKVVDYNDTPVVQGDTLMFDEYITNTTRDTATMDKIMNTRNTIEDYTLPELVDIVLNDDGRLSDEVVSHFNLGSIIGSYNIEKIVHYSFAMNIFLMWENIQQEKRLDEIEGDLCNQGFTKYC